MANMASASSSRGFGCARVFSFRTGFSASMICHATENLHGHFLCMWIRNLESWMLGANAGKECCDACILVNRNLVLLADHLQVALQCRVNSIECMRWPTTSYKRFRIGQCSVKPTSRI